MAKKTTKTKKATKTNKTKKALTPSQELAKIIADRGITQSFAGKIMGISQQHVSRLVRGDRKATPEHVATLRRSLRTR